MSEPRDLLVELGSEELPPKALRRLMNAFRDELVAGLDAAGLAHGAVRSLAAPRRLAVQVEQLATRQPDQSIERRGPALAAAYDAEGKPTKAAEGFARSCGVGMEALERLETDKGAWLVYRGVQPGQATAALLPELVQNALNKLPIPKRMRWGAGSESFVRPVHWLVLLLGGEVVPATVLGIASGNRSRGHRFHHPEQIELTAPADYESALSAAKVLVDLDARKARIREQVEAAAAELGGVAVIDDALLEEVTGLVEWPAAVVGRFEERFLEVPAEALISSMQGHQKYFPVRDRQGRLLPSFITVANIDSRDVGAVRAGNERVIRPRLSDAAFFWEQDRKRPLAERIVGQRDVVFQQQLGSLYAKTERVEALAVYLAETLKVNGHEASRAAWLAKCDLATEMVGEFPELQGIMGRYYAIHDGEPASVAQAIDEAYQPRFAGDATAASPVGQVLAIAERADTLMGIFAIGRGPSGDKDPFALRRAALGLLRTIIERQLDVDLRRLLEQAAQVQPPAVNAAAQVDAVFQFCLDRLRAYYADQGVVAELFDAVAALQPPRPLDFHQRLLACGEFLKLADAGSLAAANKRIRNILKKVEGGVDAKVDPARLVEAEERALLSALEAAEADVAPLMAEHRYAEALHRLAALREPVDGFFDKVLVMAEDPQVQANRLGLLARISQLFLGVADISRLPG